MESIDGHKKRNPKHPLIEELVKNDAPESLFQYLEKFLSNITSHEYEYTTEPGTSRWCAIDKRIHWAAIEIQSGSRIVSDWRGRFFKYKKFMKIIYLPDFYPIQLGYALLQVYFLEDEDHVHVDYSFYSFCPLQAARKEPMYT